MITSIEEENRNISEAGKSYRNNRKAKDSILEKNTYIARKEICNGTNTAMCK